MTNSDLTREVPLTHAQSALLFIDVQNFTVRRDGGEFQGLSDAERDERYGYYFDRLVRVAIPTCKGCKPGSAPPASRPFIR